jgi:hypothetical protein
MSHIRKKHSIHKIPNCRNDTIFRCYAYKDLATLVLLFYNKKSIPKSKKKLDVHINKKKIRAPQKICQYDLSAILIF